MSHAATAAVNAPWREAPRPRWRGLAVVVALHGVVAGALWLGLERPASVPLLRTVAVSLLPEAAPLPPTAPPVVKVQPPVPSPAPQAAPAPVPVTPPPPAPAPAVTPVRPAPTEAAAPVAPVPIPAPRADGPVVPAPAALSNAPAAVTAAPAAAVRAASAAPAAAAPPTAAPPTSSGPLRQPVAVACPVQATAVMPPRAVQDGIEGVVTARLLIRDGRVVQVTFLSVPVRGVFESAVRAAASRYRCQSPPGQEVEADQEFSFVLR